MGNKKDWMNSATARTRSPETSEIPTTRPTEPRQAGWLVAPPEEL